jgi:hypothetical protein
MNLVPPGEGERERERGREGEREREPLTLIVMEIIDLFLQDPYLPCVDYVPEINGTDLENLTFSTTLILVLYLYNVFS